MLYIWYDLITCQQYILCYNVWMMLPWIYNQQSAQNMAQVTLNSTIKTSQGWKPNNDKQFACILFITSCNFNILLAKLGYTPIFFFYGPAIVNRCQGKVSAELSFSDIEI